MSVYQDINDVREVLIVLHNEWANFRRDGLFVEPYDVQSFMFLMTALVKRINRVANYVENQPIQPVHSRENVIVFPLHNGAA